MKSQQGLYQRYHVTKADGSETQGDPFYFVLRLDEEGTDRKHLQACREGALAYAHSIEKHLPQVARDLKDKIINYSRKHPIPLGLYQHYKGTMYKVIGNSLDAQTLTHMVIYHPEGNPSEVWTRPAWVFCEDVEEGVPRFRPCLEQD